MTKPHFVLSRKLIILLSVLFVSPYLFGQDRPPWLDSGRLPSYPDSLFIKGVGVYRPPGALPEGRYEADMKALGEIARQVRVTVHSIVSVQDAEVTKNEMHEGDRLSSYIGSTDAMAEERLPGVTIVDRYTDSAAGLCYSFAILDRRKAVAEVRLQLAQIRESLIAGNRQISEFLIGGDNRSALHTLKSLFTSTLDYDEHAFLPIAIGWRSGEAPERAPLQVEDILARVRGLVSQIHLEKVSGEGQDIVPDKPLREPLRVKATIVNAQGRKGPARGFIVVWKSVEGGIDLGPCNGSDDEGVCAVLANQVRETSDNTYTVVASIDWSEWMDTTKDFGVWNSCFSVTQPHVSFVLRHVPLRKHYAVAVLIRERNLGESLDAAIVAAQVRDRLNEMGCRLEDLPATESAEKIWPIVERGEYGTVRRKLKDVIDLLVIGDIRSRDAGETAIGSGCRAEGEVRVLFLNDLSVVAYVPVESKGFGRTPKEAGLKAIEGAARTIANALQKQLIASEALRK
jgi:energy-converting hydrogenase A subunit M